MSLPGTILLLVRALPLELGIALAQLSVLLYLLLRPDYRTEIFRNYQLVCGKQNRWFWVRNGWTVGRNLALMARMATRHGDAIIDRAKIYVDNITQQTLEQELHTIMVSFHFGLWEFLPRVFVRRGFAVRLVTGRQRDRVLNRMVQRLRRVAEVRHNGQSRPVGHVRQVTGFMLDNTTRGEQTWGEVSGIRLRMLQAPFRMATKHHVGVIPLFAWLENGRLQVEMGKPGDAAAAAQALLNLVRVNPEQWVFWAKAGAIQQKRTESE